MINVIQLIDGWQELSAAEIAKKLNEPLEVRKPVDETVRKTIELFGKELANVFTSEKVEAMKAGEVEITSIAKRELGEEVTADQVKAVVELHETDSAIAYVLNEIVNPAASIDARTRESVAKALRDAAEVLLNGD